MRRELLQRDVPVRPGIQPAADLVIQRQDAVPGEAGQQRRRHGLGDRADLEPRVLGQSPGDSEHRPAAAAADSGHGGDDPVPRKRPVQRLESSLCPLRIPFHGTRRYRFPRLSPLRSALAAGGAAGPPPGIAPHRSPSPAVLPASPPAAVRLLAARLATAPPGAGRAWDRRIFMAVPDLLCLLTLAHRVNCAIPASRHEYIRALELTARISQLCAR